jgi:hypothetical protein
LVGGGFLCWQSGGFFLATAVAVVIITRCRQKAGGKESAEEAQVEKSFIHNSNLKIVKYMVTKIEAISEKKKMNTIKVVKAILKK